MRLLPSLKPASTYSPSSGRTNQVRQKVSQYVMRHVTSTTVCGSHTPRFGLLRLLSVAEARSIGTRSMMLEGSARARKTGTRR